MTGWEWAGSLLCVLLAGALLMLLAGMLANGQGRRRLRQAVEARDRAQAMAATSTRTLSLTAQDLRARALSLLGHADQMIGSAPPDAHQAAIVALTGELLGLADDLQDQLALGGGARVLSPEILSLHALLGDAAAVVDGMLGAGRRHWRLAEGLDRITLCADRRALAEILVRVMGNAARFSRDGDAIEIGFQVTTGGLDVTVADEGTGLLAADQAMRRANQPASRGVGLGLTLSRALMEAHGGGLRVDSAARVGTKVWLHLPPSCIVPGLSLAA